MAYNTSELYKEAIDKESRITFISGQITSENGVVIPIDNDVVSEGSCYITNQCVNSDSLEFGSVFAAEAGITLKTDISRYSLFNSKLELVFNILLSNGEYESIPMGEFYANDVGRVGKNIVIKAYDRMIDFDEPITESLTGTAVDLLRYVSERCDIELAQTESELSILPNSGYLLTVSPNVVSTYRELLSYIAKITCTFAHINRVGKLELKQFSSETSKIINSRNRATSKFSDFESYYSHVTANFYFDNELKQYSSSNDGAGLIYNAGDIPIVQGVDMTNQSIIDRMFEKASMIKYIPCEFSFIGDPAVDLGDQIENIDRDGNVIKSLVTFYKWTYRGGHQIKSAGQNPRLISSKDKFSREVASLRYNIGEKDIVVCTATNGSSVFVNSLEESKVAQVTFASNKDTVCMAMVTVPFRAEQDDEVVFTQFLDGVELPDSEISQFCHEGKGSTTFVNYFNVTKGAIHTYSIYAKSLSGEFLIEALKSRIIAFAQGLVGEISWDGTFTVGDTITPILGVRRREVAANRAIDNVSVHHNEYNPHSFIDQVSVIHVNNQIIKVVEQFDSITFE